MIKILNYAIYLLLVTVSWTQSDQNCSDIRFSSSFNTAQLFAYLTHPCIYDKHTSPLHGFNQLKTDLIYIRLHLYHLKQKVSNNLVFQTKLLIQLRWLDPRLEYGSKNYSSIILIPGELNVIDAIWTPQMYLAAARESLIPQTNEDISIQILPDGTILYTAKLMTDVVCWAELGKFPRDHQICNLNIDSWKFKSHDLQLQWENKSAISWSKEALYLAEYTLVDATYRTVYDSLSSDCSGAVRSESSDCNNDSFYQCSSLRVIFSVARNQGYYVMNYYVPSILIVTLSWVSFWESPVEIAGRCLLGAGTLLTFIVLGIQVSRSLPTVPYVRSNDLWFFGCTAFIFCSLAEFAFVNSLWRYGGMVQLKKASSKYIIRSSLKRSREGQLRRRSSWSSTPSGPRERPVKRVVNNDLTVKSLSDLELPIPLSELKASKRAMSSGSTDSCSDSTTMMSYQDIAIWIDKKSRIFFPLSFLLFNLIYWSLLFIPKSP